jgi:threonine dehydrogenase-like Zn-dependent dehydrogenase
MGMACPAGRVVCLDSATSSPRSLRSTSPRRSWTWWVALNNYRFRGDRGLRERRPDPAKLVTHRFGFERAAEAIDLIRNKPEEVCKVLLTF